MEEQQTRKRPRGLRGNTLAGLLLLGVGGVLLMRQAGYQFPDWMFRWEMILILFGLFLGIRKGFRDFSWLIIMVIGFALLSDTIWPELNLGEYLIPAIIILLGLFFLFAPKRWRHRHGPCGGPYGRGAEGRGFHERRFRRHPGGRHSHPFEGQAYPDGSGIHPGGDAGTAPEKSFSGGSPETSQPGNPGTDQFGKFGNPKAGAGQPDEPAFEFSVSIKKEPAEFQPTHEAYTDIVSIFSGIKKTILSKQFMGGEIVSVFGGAELNLTNADFTSPVVLDLVQIFGGTKLIIPANWEIRPEAATIFGGIEDKRRQPPNTHADKVLILKGSIIFGGVEVSSY